LEDSSVSSIPIAPFLRLHARAAVDEIERTVRAECQSRIDQFMKSDQAFEQESDELAARLASSIFERIGALPRCLRDVVYVAGVSDRVDWLRRELANDIRPLLKKRRWELRDGFNTTCADAFSDVVNWSSARYDVWWKTLNLDLAPILKMKFYERVNLIALPMEMRTACKEIFDDWLQSLIRQEVERVEFVKNYGAVGKGGWGQMVAVWLKRVGDFLKFCAGIVERLWPVSIWLIVRTARQAAQNGQGAQVAQPVQPGQGAHPAGK
jgi:hypothetical protein